MSCVVQVIGGVTKTVLPAVKLRRARRPRPRRKSEKTYTKLSAALGNEFGTTNAPGASGAAFVCFSFFGVSSPDVLKAFEPVCVYPVGNF